MTSIVCFIDSTKDLHCDLFGLWHSHLWYLCAFGSLSGSTVPPVPCVLIKRGLRHGARHGPASGEKSLEWSDNDTLYLGLTVGYSDKSISYQNTPATVGSFCTFHLAVGLNHGLDINFDSLNSVMGWKQSSNYYLLQAKTCTDFEWLGNEVVCSTISSSSRFKFPFSGLVRWNSTSVGRQKWLILQ